MKFSVTGENLVEYLSKVITVVPNRSPLPILDNILFQLEGNKLQMTSSDLEIFMRTELDVKGGGDGSVAVPAKRLLDITRTLTTEKLDFDVNEKNRITIKSKRGKFTLGGEPSDEFPLPEEKKDMNKIEIKGPVIKRFLSKIIHAVNTDEMRRNMAGVLTEVSADQIKIVATDGFRLGKIIKTDFKHEADTDEKIVIPYKTAQHILRLNNNEDTVIEYDDHDLKISFDSITIYSKLIDDTFPNYENVIPPDNDKILRISKHAFSDSLVRALIFADVITKRVRLEITASSLQIKADNPEIGSEGEETIDCSFNSKTGTEDFDKTPFVIAFNAGYLLDAVSQMETEELNISFGNPSKAAIITPTEQKPGEDFIELIMPVRVG
ncbi:MAG: DNA polymerase III subunit beta [Ignavibacteria bacterium]|nr:DNA polymerase III subunit beta [Ignavibacteria bacterium]